MGFGVWGFGLGFGFGFKALPDSEKGMFSDGQSVESTPCKRVQGLGVGNRRIWGKGLVFEVWGFAERWGGGRCLIPASIDHEFDSYPGHWSCEPGVGNEGSNSSWAITFMMQTRPDEI